jgi:hypothetical protein
VLEYSTLSLEKSARRNRRQQFEKEEEELGQEPAAPSLEA